MNTMYCDEMEHQRDAETIENQKPPNSPSPSPIDTQKSIYPQSLQTEKAQSVGSQLYENFSDAVEKSPELISFKSRFQYAQEQQSKRATERIMRIKQNPRQFLLHSTPPTSQITEKCSPQTSPNGRSISQDLIQQEYSPNTLWNQRVLSIKLPGIE
jgi:hypothetical protein